MSDIARPESATASLTAVSACAASGMSAVRETFEKPTPLTATLHRFSHMDVPPITVGRVQPAISRPSSAGFAALHPPYGAVDNAKDAMGTQRTRRRFFARAARNKISPQRHRGHRGGFRLGTSVLSVPLWF